MRARKQKPRCGVYHGEVKKTTSKEHRIAFASALVFFVCLVISPFTFPGVFQDDILPIIAPLMGKFSIGYKTGMTWFFALPAICAVVVYFANKFCLLASRQFQIAIVVLIVVGFVLGFVVRERSLGVDWTAHGLNPDRPGLKPQVVILSGTFSYWANDLSVNQVKSGSGFFEIRIRGSDYYYCRKWNDPEWKIGSWYEVELAIPDFAGHWGLSRGRLGSRGGGGSGYGSPDDLMPARRLWNGKSFVGANTNELEVETYPGRQQEMFKKLKKVGPYLIPKQIRYLEGDRREENYTICKVEFWNEPSTNWYWEVKRKYFDFVRSMTNNLHEPGPSTP